MAYYSLYKWFSSWSKRDYPDMIYWYKEYVLKTPEQRLKEELFRKHRARQTLLMLGLMSSLCDEISGNF